MSKKNEDLAIKLEEAAKKIEDEAKRLSQAAGAVRNGKQHRINEALSSILDLPRQAGIMEIVMLIQEER